MVSGVAPAVGAYRLVAPLRAQRARRPRRCRNSTEAALNPFLLPPAEIAALSTEQALRRLLDMVNRRVLPYVQWALGVFFFVALMVAFGDHGGRGWPLALAGLLATAGCLLALRRLLPLGSATAPARPRAPALAERFGVLLQGVLVLGYLLAAGWMAAIGGRPVILIAAAPALLLFRLVASELLLLHGLMLVSGSVLWWLAQPADALPAFVGAVPLHLVCGGLGWLLTRRFRRRFRVLWERQVSSVREQLRVRDELALAREVQLSMLPAALPQLPSLDIAAACLPANEVGGDYYDFFAVEDGLAVVVADVAGHGVASGLVLASVRSGLTLLMEDPDHALGPTMVRLDRLVQRTARRMLVTLAVARFDGAAGKMTVATAGHPPVLVRRRSGATEEVATPSPPLGTRLPATTTAVDVPFAAGDYCLLYTDGLVESSNAAGEAYGGARLAAAVEAQPADAGAQAICDAVLADVTSHRGGAAQQDDVTLVVVVGR